jgi:limonene 1,2-monooxygenase
VSASYHNPLWVAERAVQLDHMNAGAFMLGLGPGALPSDAAMIGLDMPQTRELLEDAVDVITDSCAATSPSRSTTAAGRCETPDCTCRPYTIRTPRSPSRRSRLAVGPRLAAGYGLGLLSIGATTAAGFDVLALHWDVMEERGATTASRRRPLAARRADAPAETREQAYRDVEHGIARGSTTSSTPRPFPQMAVGDGTSVREFIDFVNESGSGTIGTPDDAVGQIERLEAVERRLRRVPAARPRLGRPPRSGAATSCSHAMSRRWFQGQAAPTPRRQGAGRARRPELAQSNLEAVRDVDGEVRGRARRAARERVYEDGPGTAGRSAWA